MEEEKVAPGLKAVRDSQLFYRVKVLLAARLTVISFFMGLIAYYQFAFSASAAPLQVLIPLGIAYTLSIIYAAAMWFVKNIARFIFVQLCIDIALATSIVYFTGGINSPFSYIYLLVIIPAAILLSRFTTYMIAIVSSIIYAALLWLEMQGMVDPPLVFPPAYDPVPEGYAQLKAMINTSVYLMVSLLSAYLADLLKLSDHRLQEASKDFTLLKAFNENVLENMGAGFLAIDLNKNILSLNPAAEQILGVTSETIAMMGADDILQLPQLGDYLKTSAGKVAPAPPKLYSWSYQHPNKSTIDLNITVSPYQAEGVARGVIAVLHDVTHVKEMEQQIAQTNRLAAIGRVAAGVAHEIRNPLASLSGSIQILRDDMSLQLDESGQRLMRIVNREVERLNKIVTRFLDYAGPQKLTATNVDLAEMLSDTVTLIEANYTRNEKVRISVTVEDGLTVKCDSEQIQQVIWNITKNGIDSMDGEGIVSINGQREGDWVEISFTDTGCGIAPENIEKIFDPFFTTKHGGAGLGLATSYKIAESHGGSLTVESTPKNGALFKLRLPRL